MSIIIIATLLPHPSASSSVDRENLRGPTRALSGFDQVPSIKDVLDEVNRDEDADSLITEHHYKESNKIEPSSRIVGGTAVQFDRYPWFTVGDKNWIGCGAVLVHEQFLLTAAHCVQHWTSNGEKKAYIGAQLYNHSDHTSTKFKQERFWSEFFVHNNYNKNTFMFDSDFALLKLTKIATVTPVPLDDGTVDASLSTGADLITIGFGRTRENDKDSNSPVLQEVVVPYMDNSQCDAILGPNRISSAMICAGGEEGKDSCIGDSGGPLIQQSSSGNILVGITSFGRGCAQNGVPAVYSRVSRARAWIDQIICEHGDYPDISCPEESMSRELDTIYEMNVARSRLGRGAMVNVNSAESIELRTLDLHVFEAGRHTVRVYTKLGTYQNYEEDPTAWENMCEAEIMAQGRGIKTPIPEEACSTVKMAKNEDRAFFIVLDKEPSLLYSVVEGSDPLFRENAHLRVKSDGAGRNSQGLEGEFQMQTYSSRMFNGTFKYVIVREMQEGPPDESAPTRDADRTGTREKKTRRKPNRVKRQKNFKRTRKPRADTRTAG